MTEIGSGQATSYKARPLPLHLWSWGTPVIGGQGGIRTHGTVPRTAVFKTAALNHSATCPRRALIVAVAPVRKRLRAFPRPKLPQGRARAASMTR